MDSHVIPDGVGGGCCMAIGLICSRLSSQAWNELGGWIRYFLCEDPTSPAWVLTKLWQHLAEPNTRHQNRLGDRTQDHSQRNDAATSRASPKGSTHRQSDQRMRLVRNTGNERVIDLVRPLLGAGQEVRIVSAALSTFAFAELLSGLQAIERCQLVLPPEGSDFQLLGSDAG